jgi:mannose-6-phosphate isomerase-like protein (cupin superfamily)
VKLLKEENARVFLDGPEVCREYIVTDKITFGSSTLHPGQTGGIDPGHPVSHEIFFVAKGSVLMRNPKTQECFVLHEGDALLVEEGEPHELTNIGDTIAVITWSAAPSPSKV